MPQVWKPPSGKKKRKIAGVEIPISGTKSRIPETQLWVEKHAPIALVDVVVHSKKVGEVRAWLEERVRIPAELQTGSRVLVLTGPAGVGKSTVVRLLAKFLSLELFEWKTPTPTQWHEHLHQASSGNGYRSKLDEFEMFLENARKFPLLPVQSSTSTSPGRRVKVLLLEDLPSVNNVERQEHLCRLLHTVALSTCFMTVVLMTDIAEDAGRGTLRSGGHNKILQILEGAGASKITFNPVTSTAIKKFLTKVTVAEKLRISTDSISAIAESSGGDLRHAISALQFLCLVQQSNRASESVLSLNYGQNKNLETCTDAKCSSLFYSSAAKSEFERGTSSHSTSGRDNLISHFHALGKFLHNKRHTDHIADQSQGTALVLKESYRRNPLNMAEPESILAEAHIEYPSLLAFLHENALHFVDDEAVDDAVAMLGYLSDSDILLGRWPRQSSSSLFLSDSNDVNPYQVAATAAGSVAARGVLFANVHPAPCRWQSLRGPMLWQVERVLAEKKELAKHSQIPSNVGGAVGQIVPVRFSSHTPPHMGCEVTKENGRSGETCTIDLESDEDTNADDYVQKSMSAGPMGHSPRWASHSILENLDEEDMIEDD